MNVRELIEELKKFDENLPVYCMSDQDYVRVYIDEVYEVYMTDYEPGKVIIGSNLISHNVNYVKSPIKVRKLI